MRETAGNAIRRALHDGRFQPGQSLSEARLASEMGISRGPVREALLVLVQEGLVTHSPNRGFSVIHITAEDLQDIHQVRMPLEALALTLAAPRITRVQLSKLEALRNKMVDKFANGDLREATQFDIEFHGLIWKCSGNSKLAAALRSLLAPYFAYGSIFAFRRRSDLAPSSQRIAEEHDLVIRYLSGCCDHSAEDCIRFHLGL